MIFAKTQNEWLQMVDEAIDAVIDAASLRPRGMLERDALVSEPIYLRQMRDEVLNKPPELREEMRSRLLALSARELLAIPIDVIEQVGAVYELYRRYRRCSDW